MELEPNAATESKSDTYNIVYRSLSLEIDERWFPWNYPAADNRVLVQLGSGGSRLAANGIW